MMVWKIYIVIVYERHKMLRQKNLELLNIIIRRLSLSSLWKEIWFGNRFLPMGSKDNKYEKWSPNWKRPYRIDRCVPGNAYILETLEGENFPKALNGNT